MNYYSLSIYYNSLFAYENNLNNFSSPSSFQMFPMIKQETLQNQVQLQKTPERPIIVPKQQIDQQQRQKNDNTKKKNNTKIINKGLKKQELHECYQNRIQTSNRNINSNLLKHFLKYLQEKEVIIPLLEKIQQKYDQADRISMTQFQAILLAKFRSMKSYIRPNFVRETCYGINCRADFSRVFRILLRRYFRYQFAYRVQHMTKIDFGMKQTQIQYSRKLMNDIFRKDC